MEIKGEGSRAVTLFEKWWSKLPGYNKVAKREAIKAWKTVLKDIPTDGWDEFTQTLTEAVEKQEYYRIKMKEMSPDKFVPSRPHPATWLRQGRWLDPVPELSDELASMTRTITKCSCGNESFITMEEPLCGNCYQKKYSNNHWSMKLLRESARKLGLTKRKDETSYEYGMRAKEKLKEFPNWDFIRTDQ